MDKKLQVIDNAITIIELRLTIIIKNIHIRALKIDLMRKIIISTLIVAIKTAILNITRGYLSLKSNNYQTIDDLKKDLQKVYKQKQLEKWSAVAQNK
jgi:hypothetical protein